MDITKRSSKLKTTMSLKCKYVWTQDGKSSQKSKSVPMLSQYIKWSENDWVSDLVQLLWDNIFAKNDRVSDFSRHSGFQSKMLKKRQSLRFGSITMG